MALDFPNTPTNGQIYTSGNTSWSYNSARGVWKILSSTSPTAIISQSFTGNGSNTQYTIAGGYTIGTLAVYINGVKAVDGTDVTQTNGSTINFTTAPLNSSIIEVYGYAPAPDIVVNSLPLAGGTLTGPVTFNSNVIFSTTSSITANNSLGSSGQVLTSNGSSVYWGIPSLAFRTVTANDTITVSDALILANGQLTLTLPAASSQPGQIVYVKNINSNNAIITIVPAGTDLIDGYTSATINYYNTMWGAISVGTGWVIF